MKILFLFLMFFSEVCLARDGMNPFGFKYIVDSSTVAQVTNMPKVRSQDSFGICYAFAASTLYDEARCVQKSIADCASAPDDQKASPLDMSRFSQILPDEVDSSDRFNYEGLSEGGSAALALYNALKMEPAKESCAPFDQIVSKAKSPKEAQDLEIAMWKRFKDSYEAYKKKSKDCVACGLEYATAQSQELKDKFNLKASNTDILEAFAQDSYSKFLDRLLIPVDCWDPKNNLFISGWNLKIHPEQGQKSDYNKMIGEIKKALTKKRPLAIGFCTQEPLTVKSMKACSESKNSLGQVTGAGHEVVIKGYRRICKVDDKSKCYDAVQVQNSWGQSWQNANDDGWVDAKELLDRTFYEPQSLTWLEATK